MAALVLSALFCVQAFAASKVVDKPELSVEKLTPGDDRFPFLITTDAKECDKLCYAGHMTGGGIFYDDGKMILPATQFAIVSLAADEEKLAELSAEVTLVYENSQNTGCSREILRKYPAGTLAEGTQYSFFSELAIKNLTQRKKLYSSNLSSIRVTLNYKERTKTWLFYVAKDAEYAEAAAKN